MCRRHRIVAGQERSANVDRHQAAGQDVCWASHAASAPDADEVGRSRTSGENLFDLFMTPSSQVLKPPQISGRFTSWRQPTATWECTMKDHRSLIFDKRLSRMEHDQRSGSSRWKCPSIAQRPPLRSQPQLPRSQGQTHGLWSATSSKSILSACMQRWRPGLINTVRCIDFRWADARHWSSLERT